jgi:group I intron endonuclease
MNLAYIYLLTNLDNGKRYVGFTTNIPKRLSGHKCRAEAHTHNFMLSNAIRKHGWDAFKFEVLAECGDARYAKDVLEPRFIQEYETYYTLGKGYNMTQGGEGTLGYKRTSEECLRMSESRKGKPINLSPEQREALSKRTTGSCNPNYGVACTPEKADKIRAKIKAAWESGVFSRVKSAATRAKISQSKMGKKLTPEHVEKLRIARLGRPGHKHTEEHKKYISEKLTGRIASQETRNRNRLASAKYLWAIQDPSGTVYRTYALEEFCSHHEVNHKTIKAKWEATQKGIVKRKGSCLWNVLSREDITESMRESLKNLLDIPWETVQT